MSKYSKAAKRDSSKKVLGSERVTNHMNGDSYRPLNPLERLKMISASSIFGEPKYYSDPREKGMGLIGFRRTIFNEYEFCGDIGLDNILFYREIIEECKTSRPTKSSFYEEVINESLSFDFYSTLYWALELRRDYYMRLNPQVIMVLAALHPDRKKFTKEHPGLFNKIQQELMMRADDPLAQLAYYLWKNNGDKSNLPSILKRSIATKLSSLRRYEINKYKNAEIGMINAVRLTHAHSAILDELMRTGTVEIESRDETWEQKRSRGESWLSILESTKLGHMALLRNLRGIATEFEENSPFPNTKLEREFILKLMEELKSGVKNGKQFPFRYYSAYKALSDLSYRYVGIIRDALEECMDISIDNLPKLPGRTMCLSDNSGSAWGACTSEYGKVKIAVIDNLSSVIAAKCSDEGVVGKFGDKLIRYNISTRDGTLSQTEKITSGESKDVGGATEGGIWEFFRDAINKKEHFDNIFIFSDQQAGTGGLYGTSEHISQYSNSQWDCASKNGSAYTSMINVWKLVQIYREKVNPEVNVFSIQTAGYDNNVLPIMGYRCALLYGWTGKEILFASEYIRLWDEIDEATSKEVRRATVPHTTQHTPNPVSPVKKKPTTDKKDRVSSYQKTGKRNMNSHKSFDKYKKNNKF